jgi:uncharacterized protein DUF3892
MSGHLGAHQPAGRVVLRARCPLARVPLENCVIEITAIRLAGGQRHEHIAEVQWRAQSVSGHWTAGALIDWISQSENHEAVVDDIFRWVQVEVVREGSQPPHIRARADGLWTDNLLALPDF